MAHSIQSQYNQNNENEIMDQDEAQLEEERRLRKEQRMLASKSAYAGSVNSVKIRPQSARHNLDKYRQDVVQEQRQKKMTVEANEQLPQQSKKQRQNDHNENNSYNNNRHSSVVVEPVHELIQHKLKNIENLENLNDGMTDNIDCLDGLLIREEDDSSSDEIDSQNSMNEIIPHPPPQAPINNKYSKVRYQKHQKKLLNRRGAVGDPNQSTTTNPEILQNASINTKQEPNYTTFRPTAVTYSTNNQDPQKYKQQDEITNLNDNISLHPVDTTGIEVDYYENPNDKQRVGVENIPCTTNSSSSSSTSSQQLSSLTAPNINKEESLHLNNTMRDQEILIQDNRYKPPINNLTDLVSQKLLNEWNRSDDEVELTIEKLNEFDNNNNHDYRSQKNSQSKTNHTTNNNTNQSQKQQIILLNTSGRTSRFSEQTTSTMNHSSKSNNNSNNVNNKINRNSNNSSCANNNPHTLNAANLSSYQQNIISREKSSNSIDPWTRRDRTLVAQNVLMKHRTELEQMHINRHNSNSRQSSNTATMLTTNNKYLLPDNKYFKNKNNNF